MKKTFLAILILAIISPITGLSVPFVKYKLCIDAFNCEQEAQNQGKYITYNVKDNNGEIYPAPAEANENPVCTIGKKPGSKLKTETVIVEFMTNYDNVLLISNGNMIFKHISYAIPLTVEGHGTGKWYFYQREPSDAGVDHTIDPTYDNIAFVSSSSQNKSSTEKYKWKLPAFIPYSLRLNYNPNCTMVVKNMQVLQGDLTVAVGSAVNRADKKNWVVLLSKYPQKKDDPPAELVKLQFDVVYYGYTEVEEEE